MTHLIVADLGRTIWTVDRMSMVAAVVAGGGQHRRRRAVIVNGVERLRAAGRWQTGRRTRVRRRWQRAVSWDHCHARGMLAGWLACGQWWQMMDGDAGVARWVSD
ncbi:hypothetical protein ACLOJK_022842 [Asimina triloba]